MSETVTERLWPDEAALAHGLAEAIAAGLTAAVKARGVASLVVTGGSTPGPLYDVLCEAQAPWERVFVTLSDERWVSTEDAASNEHLVRTRLLRGRAERARFVGLKTADAAPEAAVAAVEAAVAALPHPFDVVLLGMGGDGHVASLFPGAAETRAAMDLSAPTLVCAVNSPGADGAAARMSLTFRALRDARWTVLMITGEDKLAVARRAADGDDAVELPVRGVLNGSEPPVEIWWAP